MIYVENFDIPRAVYDKYEPVLRGTEQWLDGDEECVTVFSVNMGDDFEIDFNVNNCEHDSPYLDVVLVDHGCEMYTWEISNSLLGCWEAVFGGVTQKAFRVETFI